MSVFGGSLHNHDQAPINGSVQIEDGRVRIMTDRRRLASWDQSQVRCERSSVFRFELSDGLASYEFHPLIRSRSLMRSEPSSTSALPRVDSASPIEFVRP